MSLTYDLHEPSTNGTSSWLQWLDCPVRAARYEQSRADGIIGLGSPNQHIGILTHAYLDLYHTRCLAAGDLGNVQFKSWGREEINTWHTGDSIAPTVFAEAQRLSSAWMATHPWDYFGDEVHTELTLGDAAGVRLYVTGSKDHDWSGRLDLLAGRNGTVRVIDWKTAAKHDPNAGVQYKHNFQLRAYMLAAAATGYVVSGATVVMLIKTKVPDFVEIPLDFPTRREIAELHAMFKHVALIRKERRDEVNTKRCFDDWGKACPYLLDGSCARM